MLVAPARDVQVRSGWLTEEMQREFADLERDRIDTEEAVLIAMEMEELVISLQKVNRRIVPVRAI